MVFAAVTSKASSKTAKKEALFAVALLDDFVDPEYSNPPDKKHGVAVFLIEKGVDLGEYSSYLTGPLGVETKAQIDLRFRGRKIFYKFYGRDTWAKVRPDLYEHNPSLKKIHEKHPDKEILLAGISKFLFWIPVLNSPNNYYIERTLL